MLCVDLLAFQFHDHVGRTCDVSAAPSRVAFRQVLSHACHHTNPDPGWYSGTSGCVHVDMYTTA